MRAVDGAEQALDERNALETLFDKYLGEYNPYLRDTRSFDAGNTLWVLEGTDVSCPYVDYRFRMLPENAMPHNDLFFLFFFGLSLLFSAFAEMAVEVGYGGSNGFQLLIHILAEVFPLLCGLILNA